MAAAREPRWPRWLPIHEVPHVDANIVSVAKQGEAHALGSGLVDAKPRSLSGLSATPLLERRMQELGIDATHGTHANRPVLLGGASPAADAVLLRGNDYLCLRNNPEAKEAALLREVDAPVGDRRRGFEQTVASLLGAEDAVLTMSGAHAVRGLLETLCGARTPVYADELSWTAGSLRGAVAAPVTPFAHNDMTHLRRLAASRPGVIVLDGVYGSNGAVASVSEAAEVAEATGSVLVVDETHSFGCAAGGLGICEEQGVSQKVHFRAIGLSKAMASRGGVVIGPSRALEAVRFVDRHLIWSTAPLEAEVAAYEATLRVLLRDEWRREALRANHAALRRGLLDLGYTDAAARSDRQILSVVTGSAARTIAFRDYCAERGVFGAVFCPPAAEEGRSFLRFTIHCGLGEDERARFLGVMEAARPLLGMAR